MIKKRTPAFRPKNVNIESKMVDKKANKVSIEVDVIGLDELLVKSQELVKTLEKVKSLENELTNINLTVNANFEKVDYLAASESKVVKGLIEDITECLDTVDLTDLKQVDVHVYDSQGLASKLAIRLGEH